MVRRKTPEEIESLAAGGCILSQILDELEAAVKPGVTPAQLDSLATGLLKERGVKPSFLGYRSHHNVPYPSVSCISVNAAVVHGLPNNIALKEGDIVGIDLGLIYRGLYLDSARTVPVGRIFKEAERLLAVTRQALAVGIAAAQVGHTTGHIGQAVQQYVEGEGLSVVRQLVGHGVGYAVHEDPPVPNFGKAGEGHKLESGLVIAIEPMVTSGDPTVTTAADGWTVVTKSGAPAAHFEHTVAVTKEGPRILTQS